MKKSRLRPFLYALLSLVLILTFLLPISASPRRWTGIAFVGALPAEDKCPLTVTHERLIFDIPGFEKNRGSVTAEYTLYNPYEEPIQSPLLFPLGCPTANTEYDSSTIYDNELYGVFINDAPVSVRIRHTRISGEQFEASTHTARLKDEKLSLPFFTDEMTVTKYELLVYNLEGGSGYAVCDATMDQTQTKLLSGNVSLFVQDPSNSITSYVSNGISLTVYAVGAPLTEPLSWHFYTNSLQNEEVNGKVTLVSTETTSFRELVFSNYDKDGAHALVSETDWYNAVTDSLTEEYPYLSLEPSLMRWYEYELTLAPKETLFHSVKAPLYPNEDFSYDPAVYTYPYLFPPATRWQSFGELEIIIRTPLYLGRDSSIDFEKTDEGYRTKLSVLPEGELYFSLCSKKNPKKEVTAWTILGVIFLGIGLFFMLFIALLPLLLILFLIFRRRKKRKNKRTT